MAMQSFFLVYLALLVVLVLLIHAHPPGTLLVSKVAQPEHYLTVQAAVDALSLTDEKAQHIYISEGHYEESVSIPARKATLHIKGATSQEDRDDHSYHGNLVTIGHRANQGMGLTNDQTATLQVHMNNFTLHNVNVINEYLQGGPGGQALALSAVGDRQSYLGSSFTGYIDVICSEGGDQFFAGK